MVTLTEICINVGILLGYIMSYAFSFLGGDSWRAMLAFGAIIPFAMIFISEYVMPETPRWLFMQGRESEAVAILR